MKTVQDTETVSQLSRGGPIQIFYTGESRPLPTIERADGVYMWDTLGKRYLDASSGPVVSNIGHSNKRVLQAMHEQAEKVCFASRTVFENTPNKELAGKLVDLAGPGFDQAFIVSGGSEATEAAIKLARQYVVASGQETRWKVLSLQPSYHGSTLGAASVSGDPESADVYESITRVMPKVPCPLNYRLPKDYTGNNYDHACAQKLEDIILSEGPESVLAFIIEPVGGLATGALVASDDYYRMVRDICTKYGVLLIYDEVISGAGRTGTFLAAEHWPDAQPDLVTLAKGVAAGYTPLGVVLAPNQIVKPVVDSGGFLHGHTYSANPLSCAVANAVLDELIENNLMANATAMGEYLMAQLNEIAANSRIIGDVRGKGLLMAVEIVADKTSKAILPFECRAVYRLLEIGIKHGLLLYTRKTAGGAFGEWLMVTPPLTLKQTEADELATLFKNTISDFERELTDAGFLQ